MACSRPVMCLNRKTVPCREQMLSIARSRSDGSDTLTEMVCVALNLASAAVMLGFGGGFHGGSGDHGGTIAETDEASRLEQAQAIYEEEWRRELIMQDELFMKLHARLPKELIFQRELLLARL